MNKRKVLGVITGIIVSNIIVISGLHLFHIKHVGYSKYRIQGLNALIKKYSLDDTPLEDRKEGMYRGLVSGLEDESTWYLNKEEFLQQQEMLNGKYVGTGIVCQWGVNTNYLIITDIVPESPADKAGIKQGDRIIALDDKKVMLSNQTLIYDKLLSSIDDTITYTIECKDKKIKQIPLTSTSLVIQTLKTEWVDDKTEYISIVHIQKNLVSELEKTIKILQSQGKNKWILDLRDVESNQIEVANELSNLFIDNTSVYKQKDRQGQYNVYTTSNGDIGGKLYVLVNQGTEGTIEAFVESLKQTNRAVVIGETTAGRGKASEPIALKDGTGVMVASKELYTMQDISLVDNGVKPHIMVQQSREALMEYLAVGRMSREKDRLLQEAIKQLNKED